MADQRGSTEKSATIQLTELASTNTSEIALAATHSTQVEALQRWPQQPGPIQNEPKIEIALTMLDFAMMILPVTLMVKTSLCIYVWQIDSGNSGIFFEEASAMSPLLIRLNGWLVTLFTILFVSIITTLLRRYALWKAERGATIAELEQYQASISLPATLKAIWSLRAFSITSIGLVFLWGWYYAGSQAIQREYALLNSDPYSYITIAYLSPNATSPFDNSSFGTYSQVQKTDIVSLFHLYSQNTPPPGDSFQGDNIPLSWDTAGYALPIAFDASTTGNVNEWTKTKASRLLTKVSSIGNKFYVPYSWYENGTNKVTSMWAEDSMIGKYNYNYSYISLNCSHGEATSSLAPNGSWPTFTTIMNMTTTNDTLDTNTARTLDLWVRYNGTTSIQGVCNISQIFVEYSIDCLADGCKISAMRQQPGKISPSPRTKFDSDQFASEFIDSLLYACGRPNDYTDTSILEADIATSLPDVETLGSVNLTLQQYIDESTMMTEFSLVLTRYFNTWYTASQRLRYESFNHDMAMWGNVTIPATNDDFSFTRMHGAAYDQHYKIYWPWIVLDYTSCLVLLVAAVVSYRLRLQTLAPDIFGYVSSLTRDNPNFELPGGSTLPGMERSKKLRNVKVKIGDLNGRDGVGRIGMKPLDPTHDPNLRDLERNRQYL